MPVLETTQRTQHSLPSPPLFLCYRFMLHFSLFITSIIIIISAVIVGILVVSSRVNSGAPIRPNRAHSRGPPTRVHPAAHQPPTPLKHPSRPRLRARFLHPREVQPKRRQQQQAMTDSSKRTVNSTRASRSTRLTDAGKLKSSRLAAAFGASSSLAGPFRRNSDGKVRDRFGGACAVLKGINSG